MNFEEFQRRALRVYESVPEKFRIGVEGIEVSRKTVPHPTLPEIYTLGECITEEYPTEFGGPGDVQSVVVLYFGSFRALAEIDEAFDWDYEIEETVLHELRHHLESLATDDSLERVDYAEDQNFARRHGTEFDPYFYRLGEDRARGVYEVDDDVFIEVGLTASEVARLHYVRFTWNHNEWLLPVPAPLGDVHYVRVDGIEGDLHELYVVLVRKLTALGWARRLLGPSQLVVLQSEAEAVPVESSITNRQGTSPEAHVAGVDTRPTSHEVRHHLESLASEDDLEEMDYAEDQNFARREGDPFDPFFFRSGTPLGDGSWAVDGDLFVERPIDALAFQAQPEIAAPWPGGELRVPRPDRLGDVHFVYAGESEGGGERFVVLVRRRGVGEWIRGLLGSARLEVLTTDPPHETDDGG